MSIEITPGEELSGEQWNRLVERSTTDAPFHHYAVVETIDEYTDATLHPLVGYKGEEPIGVFPLFEKTIGPVSFVFSPPRGLRVPYFGPLLLNTGELKTRRRDVRNHRFIQAVTDWVQEHIAPRFVKIQTTTGYTDMRPLGWAGHDVKPRYTYEVNLPKDSSELLARFSRDARSNIRADYDRDVTITRGEPSDIDWIHTQVRERFEAQSEPFALPVAFLHDLYDRLPEGVIRLYVCRIDGSIQGGIYTIETENTIYSWFGGAKTDSDIPVNDLLDWHICQDAIDRGLKTYDLVGAGDERIYRYKAKFAPDLRTFFKTEKATWEMNVVAEIYSHLQSRGLTSK